MGGRRDGLRIKRDRDSGEIRLLEGLGIRRFRQLLLALERYRHRKDGGRNGNYHLERGTAEAVSGFDGYLLYHSLLHLAAILLLAVPACVLHAAVPRLHWADGILLLLFLLNLYCLLLQRYTFLRIRRLKRRSAARSRDGRPVMLSSEGTGLATALCRAMERGETIVLDRRHIPGLLDIAGALPGAAQEEDAGQAVPIHLLAPGLKTRLRLPGRRERLCHGLQRIFTPKRRPMLSRGAAVTADGETEAAYLQAFGRGLPEAKLRRLLSGGGAEGGGPC